MSDFKLNKTDVFLAQEWYGQTTNSTGTSIYLHVLEVVKIIETVAKKYQELSPSKFTLAYRIALGHDLLEDTKVNVEIIRNTWGDEVVNHILELSNKKGDSDFDDYIEYLAHQASELSLLIKFSDILANLNNSLKNRETISPDWIQSFWLPLLERYQKELISLHLDQYPHSGAYLASQINKGISRLKASL